jgi:hypothetical protein
VPALPVLMLNAVTVPLVGEVAGKALPSCTPPSRFVQGGAIGAQSLGWEGPNSAPLRSLPTVIEAVAAAGRTATPNSAIPASPIATRPIQLSRSRRLPAAFVIRERS